MQPIVLPSKRTSGFSPGGDPDLYFPLGTGLVEQSHFWVGNIPLYPWQIDILIAAMEPHSRVIFSTANESGKTSLVGVVFLLSIMLRFPGASCFATSGSERQIEEQLFGDNLVPIVERLKKKDPRWQVLTGKMKVTAPNGSTCLCYVCKKAQNVEGFHGKWVPDDNGELIYRPCAYLLDECKSVPDGIHEGVRRIDPDFMVAMSTPGEMNGFFHSGIDPDTLENIVEQRKRKQAEFIRGECDVRTIDPVHHFPGEFWTYRRKLGSDVCPHLNSPLKKRERENIRKKYGSNSPFVKSMLEGEFQASSEGNMIYQDSDTNLMKESMAQSGDFTPTHGDIRAAGDISGGGDKQVLMIRCGTEILMIDSHECATDIEQAEYWVTMLKQLGIAPHQFTVDGGGIGSTVANYMELRLNYQGINRFMANNGPSFDFQFQDRYTELHWAIKDLLSYHALVVPWCPELVTQMRDRRYVEMAGDEKLKTEPKKDGRKRHGYSPDYLDTIVYLFNDFPIDAFRRGIIYRREREVKVYKVEDMNKHTALQGRTRTVMQGLQKQKSMVDLFKTIRK